MKTESVLHFPLRSPYSLFQLSDQGKELIHTICKTAKAALIGPFTRIPFTFAYPILLGLPHLYFSLYTKSYKAVTEKNIYKKNIIPPSSLPKELKVPSNRKFFKLLKRAEKLRQKLVPNQQIMLFSTPRNVGTHVFNHVRSSPPVPIIINIKHILCSKEEQKFILAHELAHVQQNHALMRFYFSVTILLIDLIALAIFPPFILVVEGLSSLLERRLSIHHEIMADRIAMRCLNSSEGAVSLMKKSIRKLKAIKTGSDQIAKQSIDPRLRHLYNDPKKLQNYREMISKKGYILFNDTHPNEIDRLKLALKFKPV